MTTPAMHSTTPPAGGGMPRWLIFALVALLIIILGCCGGIAACNFMCAAAGHAVRNGAPAIGNLTTQALNQQGVAIDTSGQGLSLPADFPADIPIASGFKLRSKFTPPGAMGGTLSFTGTDAPATLAAYYEKEMAKQGWTQAGASADADTFTQSYSKEKRTVIFIGGGKAGQSSLQITYGTQQ